MAQARRRGYCHLLQVPTPGTADENGYLSMLTKREPSNSTVMTWRYLPTMEMDFTRPVAPFTRPALTSRFAQSITKAFSFNSIVFAAGHALWLSSKKALFRNTFSLALLNSNSSSRVRFSGISALTSTSSRALKEWLSPGKSWSLCLLTSLVWRTVGSRTTRPFSSAVFKSGGSKGWKQRWLSSMMAFWSAANLSFARILAKV
mmetsp:Transcript_12094/g.36481  ORF Transcript_12094/g.36481 Transcript_12094/m.36481 type:complete len:203 (-) Transcript_12094:958-1566(-)